MSRNKIAFIGAGKMAEALIGKLKGTIIASDIDTKRLHYLRARYGVKLAKNNGEAFAAADIVILAVKPQQLGKALDEMRNAICVTRKKKIIVSIAAGIPLAYLRKKIPGHQVVRVMPNNPALIGAGITAIASDPIITRYSLLVTRQIFSSVGEVVEVPERLMDAVTGLSGSGPAYVYLMIEAMTAGGVKVGLPKPVAAKLARQTVLGAVQTVESTGREPAELRRMVTSPGGTTLEGLSVLERRKFADALIEAIEAAAKKSARLSKQWAI